MAHGAVVAAGLLVPGSGAAGMAACSPRARRPCGLLPASHRASILLFQRLQHGWVREVHLHTSKRKRGKTYVLFRNAENRVVESGVAGLVRHLEEHGEDAGWVDWRAFLSERDPRVVSDRVGANRRARREAERWVREVLRGRPAEDDPWSGLCEAPRKPRRVGFQEEEGEGGSLGTYPTTPGPAGSRTTAPDIIINTCEVRPLSRHGIAIS